LVKDPKLLNEKQKIGLNYYEDILKRIPRTEMEAHEKLLLGALLKGMKGTVVGSYRRGLESSGDIDMLITMTTKSAEEREKAFQLYIEKLKMSGYMIEVLSEGNQKCLSIVKLDGIARRLDLLVVPTEQFPFALMYFTGSGDFNVAFRKHALSLGYTLNEHEMKPTGKKDIVVKPIPLFKYEAEIFAFLGLQYKEPAQRLGASSVMEITPNTKAKIESIKKTRKRKSKG
jgi:DNA polymerase beta